MTPLGHVLEKVCAEGVLSAPLERAREAAGVLFPRATMYDVGRMSGVMEAKGVDPGDERLPWVVRHPALSSIGVTAAGALGGAALQRALLGEPQGGSVTELASRMILPVAAGVGTEALFDYLYVRPKLKALSRELAGMPYSKDSINFEG